MRIYLVGCARSKKRYEEYRGKGIGTYVIKEIENELKAKGIETIRLHVFQANQIACKLYDKLGFVPESYSIDMKKDL